MKKVYECDDGRKYVETGKLRRLKHGDIGLLDDYQPFTWADKKKSSVRHYQVLRELRADECPKCGERKCECGQSADSVVVYSYNWTPTNEAARKCRLYIAGPMRGIPFFNFPAFDSAYEELTDIGYEVVSPADLDRVHGFDPYKLPESWDWTKVPENFDLTAAIDRDIAAIRSCDAVYMLEGWENSVGARAEKAIAEWCGKEVLFQEAQADADNAPASDLKAWYFEFHRGFCDKMQAVTKAKNHDYTGASADPFANFSQVEKDDVCTTEQGFLVRMTDKFQRIRAFVKLGVLKVQDEKVEDTLHDLANYCALMAGYIKAKKEGRVK